MKDQHLKEGSEKFNCVISYYMSRMNRKSPLCFRHTTSSTSRSRYRPCSRTTEPHLRVSRKRLVQDHLHGYLPSHEAMTSSPLTHCQIVELGEMIRRQEAQLRDNNQVWTVKVVAPDIHLHIFHPPTSNLRQGHPRPPNKAFKSRGGAASG